LPERLESRTVTARAFPALARQYKGLNAAAAALGYADVSALQSAIMAFAKDSNYHGRLDKALSHRRDPFGNNETSASPVSFQFLVFLSKPRPAGVQSDQFNARKLRADPETTIKESEPRRDLSDHSISALPGGRVRSDR
jgi:hypothetical protein